MILLFILMFSFLIIAPFAYFMATFRHFPMKFKVILFCITLFSLIVMMIKIFIHPYSQFFFSLTNIVLFYILSSFIFMICLILYRLILSLLHKQSSTKLLMIIIVCSLTITSIGFITHYHKTVQSYQVTIDKQSSLSELKVALISDMHIGTGTDINNINQLVKDLNQKSYDLVCFGGDLFDESTPTDMIEDVFHSLSQIQSKYGIFSINGNHEHYAGILDSELYNKYHIYHLCENYVCVDGLFNIVGREDVSRHDSAIQQVIQNMDTSLLTIVLYHNPKRYKEVMDFADLQLSGHTHGGQVFPLTLITSLLFDDVYGFMEKDDFSLIVTSGYGSWGFPFRLLTNCEYVDVSITFSKK